MSGGPNFEDALIQHLPPRFKKHPDTVTIYLQCLKLNGKDTAVLGKQVLVLNAKKDFKIHVQSLGHCYALV